MDPITIVRSAIGTVIVAAILLIPVHEVEQAKTLLYLRATLYCHQPLWSLYLE